MRLSTPPSDTARVAKRTSAHQNAACLHSTFELEADHRAEASHLAQGQFVLGMRLEANVAYLTHFRLLFQPPSDFHRTPLGPLDSYSQGL